MPRVAQAHMDARRQQILDAARARFAAHGFARTSMADIVAESGLSTGAIYRYFRSKDEIVVAVCRQGSEALPEALTTQAVTAFLQHVRVLAREKGHARLTAQIIAEAALSPALAEVVRDQLTALRDAVASLLQEQGDGDVQPYAESFVALCSGYSQQLAVRGDVDPAPFVVGLMALVAAADLTADRGAPK